MTAYDAERALTARDPDLPGLGLLLDSAQLLAALRTLAPFARARSLRETYLRYKPGTSCVLAFEIALADGERRYYFAKALTRERFSTSWRNPRRQALVAARHPQAPLALEEAAVLIQHPAQDRGIRYLRLLWDAQQRAALLRGWLPEIAPAAAEVEWRLLRYKPERRCVIGCYLAQTPLAIVRCASAKAFGDMLQGYATGNALGHAAQLGVQGEHRLLASRWIPGQSLDQRLDEPDALTWVKRAGDALARIHNAPFCLAMRGHNGELRRMLQTQNTLQAIYPDAAARFQRCAREIARRLGAFAAPAVILHGDFSADQVIVSAGDGCVHLIDWDHSRYGHPLSDFATFCARLELEVIEGKRTPAQAAAIGKALLQGYTAQRTLCADGLPWYTACALLALATEPFRQRDPHWPAQINALLQRAEQLIAPPPACEDACWQAQLDTLCSPRMAGPLRHALRLAEGDRLLSCTVIRQKTGRRALIEYRLAVADRPGPWVVLGKYRDKGADRHAFSCQHILWEGGFGARAAVSVPEPLALLPSLRLWLQQKVDAELLTRFLLRSRTPQPLVCAGTAVGHALAALQQHAALGATVAGRRWDVADELRVLAQGLEAVADAYPHWRSRLSALRAACERRAQRRLGAQIACVHRDFYPDQILIDRDDPGRLTLLDFDLCCTGAAALDAGNYLAHIRELALRHCGDIQALRQHESAFLQAWLSKSPSVGRGEVADFLALSLVRHIFLSTRFADRGHTTPALLDYCERLMMEPACDE